MAIPNEAVIREDTENIHRSLLRAAKDATIPASSVFPVSMIDNILPSPLLTIYSSLLQTSTFVKKV